jgi:outer membrane protein assembly factor BamA
MRRLSGTIIFCLMPVFCLADEEIKQEIDASCKPFEGSVQKVSEVRKSRLDNNLFKDLEGKTIRHIEYKTIPVFDESDPDENNRLYRFVNKLHINTRPKVIRAQLLFKEGDLLERKHIQESERILRTRNYLSNAYIVPLTVCANAIDLLVVTQDSWSLEPQFSLSKESEGTKSGFAIADGNILGTGNSFTVGYEENSERNLIHYEFSNPHIFNSQIAAKLNYADTSDGKNTIVDLSHPFYSLETPWSAGIYTEDYTQDDSIRFQDTQINSFVHESIKKHAYYGIATEINDDFTRRLLFGVSQEEDSFFENEDTLQPIPQDRKAIYPWVEFQYLENHFGIYKNINQIQRPEDIALGNNLVFRLGYGGKSFDNLDDVLRYIGMYQHTTDVSDKHILETSVSLDGRYHTKDIYKDSSVLGITSAYHYFLSDKSRWFLGVQYHIGQDLAQYEELTVGDITGLRGYPADFQRGNERYLLTIERRYFSNVHIFNLSRLGAVVFFDTGKAWGVDQYGKSLLLSNVGFGLRLSPTKVRIGNVVHIDFAVPTSSKKGADDYQLTIGAYQKF